LRGAAMLISSHFAYRADETPDESETSIPVVKLVIKIRVIPKIKVETDDYCSYLLIMSH
jgi:hypothetical protein